MNARTFSTVLGEYLFRVMPASIGTSTTWMTEMAMPTASTGTIAPSLAMGVRWKRQVGAGGGTLLGNVQQRRGMGRDVAVLDSFLFILLCRSVQRQPTNNERT